MDRILNPSVVWVLVPLMAISFWGIASVLRALRGTPVNAEELEHCQVELQQLRERIEALERAQRQQAAEARRP